MKTVWLTIQVILALIGFLDASYLTWEKITGHVPSCNVAFQCEAVLNSSWSSFGPVPISALGALFYLTFLILIVTRFLGKEEITMKGVKISLQKLSTIWAIIGLGVSVLLVTIMAVVLKSWCLFCLISASTSTLLALTTFLLYFSHDQERPNEH